MAKRSCWTIFVFAILILIMPVTAWAFTLSFEGAFDFDGADGIAFNATSGNLFLAQTFFDINDDAIQTRVVEVTTSGNEVSRFNPEQQGLTDVQGLSFLPSPNPNLLLTEQDTSQSGVREYSPEGTPVPGGTNFSTLPISDDGDGVIFHPTRSTVFIADDLDESIYEYTLDGTLLNTIVTSSIFAGFVAPEGITVDPLTDNLLVVDAVSGTKSLYVLTPSGELISTVDLEALTGFTDPEGVTIDRSTNTLYVAFDLDDKIGTFSIQPSQTVPEPSTGWLLGPPLLGLMGLRMWRKMKNPTHEASISA